MPDDPHSRAHRKLVRYFGLLSRHAADMKEYHEKKAADPGRRIPIPSPPPELRDLLKEKRKEHSDE